MQWWAKEIRTGDLGLRLAVGLATQKSRAAARLRVCRLAPLDSLQFLLECGFDLFGTAFAPGDPADVRTIDAELFGDPAVQAPI
jgi:hypothetical protein